MYNLKEYLTEDVVEKIREKIGVIDVDQIVVRYLAEEIRLFDNMDEFVRWYYEDNEESAVDHLIELSTRQKHLEYDNFTEYLLDATSAIILNDGKVLFVFE